RVGVDAAERNCDDLGLRGHQGLLHLLEGAEPAGADDQAGAPTPATELERVGGAALNGREHLDLLTLLDPGPPPLAARNHLAVDGDCHPATLERRAGGLDRGGDSGPLRQAHQIAIEVDVHPTSTGASVDRPVNRRGENGSRSIGASSPASRAAMHSAVIGAWSTPFRKWPRATSSPSAAPAPSSGALSREPGRS